VIIQGTYPMTTFMPHWCINLPQFSV